MKRSFLKKIVSVVASVAMAICMLPATAFAEDPDPETTATNYTIKVSAGYSYLTSYKYAEHPQLKLYKTAGLISDTTSDYYNYDYVGTYVKDDVTQYVFEPSKYIIEGNAADGWTIQETADGPSYTLNDYQPVDFTDSTFGTGSGNASGTVNTGSYMTWYASLESGRYSYRGYGINSTTKEYDVPMGGMSLDTSKLTSTFTLRLFTYGTTSKTLDNVKFSTDQYKAVVSCPTMGCNAVPGSNITVGTAVRRSFFLYAAGDNCPYDLSVIPNDTVNYAAGGTANYTSLAATQATPVQKSDVIAGYASLKVTVPSTTEFGLYQYKSTYNNQELAMKADPVVNENGTTTYSYTLITATTGYNWRMKDTTGTYVTKGGWLTAVSSNTELSFGFEEGDATAKKSHEGILGTTVANYDESDLLVNLGASGFKSVGTDASAHYGAFRNWGIASSNALVEPDFNWQVVSGDATITSKSAGNAGNNWVDVNPTGTAIVATSYDAVNVYSDNAASSYGKLGGLFAATDPARVAVSVISDTESGTADAQVAYGSYGTTQVRGAQWDYNYDTWYYLDTDENPTLDFTVTGNQVSKVEVATVTANANDQAAVSDWAAVSATNGTYKASLAGIKAAGCTGGTAIIKMTDATGVSYRCVRVAQMGFTYENEFFPDEAVMPGDTVKITFTGLYRGVSTAEDVLVATADLPTYMQNGTMAIGTLANGYKASSATLKVTVPTDISFDEGASSTLLSLVTGCMKTTAKAGSDPFAFLYNTTEEGLSEVVTTSTNIFGTGHLADISIPVAKKAYRTIKFNVKDAKGTIDGASVTLSDESGAAIEANEDGTFTVPYGNYVCDMAADGHVGATKYFKVSSATKGDDQGQIVMDVTLDERSASEWDGTTTTEPAKDEEGTYLVGTGAELAWIASTVNAGTPEVNVKLTADIDLGGYNWTPIGSQAKPYTGNFDGQGHSITHFYYSCTPKSGSVEMGLFGYAQGAKGSDDGAYIKNLTLEGTGIARVGTSSAYAYCAGIVSHAYACDLENLINRVDVYVVNAKLANGTYSTVSYAGGVAYFAQGNTTTKAYGTIKNCVNEAEIVATAGAGGILCEPGGWLNICDCINKGNVTGGAAAGIIGTLLGTTGLLFTVSNCANTGSIHACRRYMAVVGKANDLAAGIVSAVSSSSSVTNCYNTGSVKADAGYACGIFATATYNTSGIVTGCFNTGTVTAKNVGGIGGGASADGSINLSNNYYLESAASTCFADFELAAEEQAQAVTAEDLASAGFVDTLNAIAQVSAYVPGTSAPMLAWENTPCATCKADTANVVAENDTTASCIKKAHTGAVTCAVCGAVKYQGTDYGEYSDHAYNEPTFVFSEDGKTAVANWTCANSAEHKGSVDAVVTSEVTTEPTCTSMGVTTYTATVTIGGQEYLDTCERTDVAKLPHTYDATTHKCTVCQKDEPTVTLGSGEDAKTVYSTELADVMASKTLTCIVGTESVKVETEAVLVAEAMGIDASTVCCFAVGDVKVPADVAYFYIGDEDAICIAADGLSTDLWADDVQSVIPVAEHTYARNGHCTICDDFDEDAYLQGQILDQQDQLDQVNSSLAKMQQQLAQTQLLVTDTDIDAKVGAKGAITVKWNANGYATGYVLTRDGVQIYEGSALSYTDNNVKLGTTYTYKVIPVMAYNESVTLSGKTATVAAKSVATVVRGGLTYLINGKSAQVVGAKAAKASATVLAKVTFAGKSYKVTSIAAGAFKGSKVTKLIVKSKKLVKKSVKNCLKGSKVKRIVYKTKKSTKKVSGKRTIFKTYKKIFSKANAGKKVTISKQVIK